MDPEIIKVGDVVRKKKGMAYCGIVISVYMDLYGIEHADVQVPGEKGVDDFAGMIHLYPTDMLYKI